MSDLLTMTCRRCGARLFADPARKLGERAYRYTDLVFRCEVCQVGYSNASSEADRVEIAASPAGRVPAEVQEGLSEALAAAVNVNARAGKRWKFCSEASEDAATWTIIRALQLASRVGRVASAVGAAELATGSSVRVLFWGAPTQGPDAASRTAAVLAEISADLGEDGRRRSEPDVVVCWDDLVVVIEAKLRSGNDRQTKDLHRFDRYLRRPELWGAAPDKIKKVGFYELVRNWVIAWELAERTGARHAILANLAPSGHAADVDRFRQLVADSQTRRVEHVPWRELLVDPAPAWLESYAQRLGLRPL